MFFFRVISFNPFWEFLRLENSAWDFLGLIVGPGILGGFVGSPRDFLGFDFCPHLIDHPRHLKSGVRPRGRAKVRGTRNQDVRTS